MALGDCGVGTIIPMTTAELKTFIPPGHEIVMMLDAKDGCRVFTSSKPDDDGWEQEVLIPAHRLIHQADRALEFPPIRSRSSRVA